MDGMDGMDGPDLSCAGGRTDGRWVCGDGDGMAQTAQTANRCRASQRLLRTSSRNFLMYGKGQPARRRHHELRPSEARLRGTFGRLYK